MIGSICIIVRKPKGEERSTLAIRTAWATHAGAFDTKLLFIDDGVYNLLSHPGYNTEMLKAFLKEGGQAFAVSNDLQGRGLSADQILEGAQVIREEDVQEIIRDSDTSSLF